MVKAFLKSLLLLLYFGSGLLALEEATVAKKATDPLSHLHQVQFESDLTLNNIGSKDVSNIFYIKPIIPVEQNNFFWPQLIRAEFQVISLPKSRGVKPCTVLGDTQLFDLFVKETSWGRWGIGPIFIFPTAGKEAAGQGKWQLGPALGISIIEFEDWQFGFLLQNPIAFAGISSTSYISMLYFQPFFTRHFKNNWYISSNPQWTMEWKSRNVQIPINIGIGKVFGTKYDASLYGEWLAYKKGSGVIPQFTLQFCFNILLGEKGL